MDLRVLGALEIHDGNRVVRPRRQMARVLLGVLALRANQPLSRDWLVDALWDGCPPESAEANVRSYVSHLRELLGDTGPAIETAGGGYVLRASPAQLDWLRFVDLADEGRHARHSGDPGRASEILSRALGLWRGPVLAGLALPAALGADVERLEERRLAADEDLGDAYLADGRHREAVDDLAALVREHPLRERFWEQLILALYLSDRSADALAAYQRLVAVLRDELGVEPGRRIQELRARILRNEPAPQHQRKVPWQLPPPVERFVGRAEELSALDDYLRVEPGEPVRIAVIAGTAGAGKTALALRWAYRARERFPDGCLYADLGGFGPQGPQRPDAVQIEVLQALGREPAEPLTGTYRTELSGRRLLLVLDNAADAEQVRPLLPGDSCAVLITSRDMLTGLTAREGARRVDLPALPAGDAVALLRELTGAAADEAALAQLADQCARLPLALRIAAEMSAHHMGTPLSTLVRELADEQARLDLLDAGDPHTAVRSVLSWSIRQLSEPVADAFRRIGLYPGRHLDAYALAALSDRPGRPLIHGLLRAHLIEEVSPGRYAPHDLLRGYARELAQEIPGGQREAALGRLLDQQAATASRAMDLVYAHEPQRRPKVGPAAVPGPRLSTVDEAREWLDDQLANLLALAASAPAEYVGLLSGTLQRHLLTRGRYVEAADLSALAVASAAERSDSRAEAAALLDHGLARLRMGHHDRAGEAFGRAADLHEKVDDPYSAAATLKNLGMVHYHYGRLAEALSCLERALAISRRLADRGEEGATLNNIGLVHEWSGDWDRARDCYRRALAIQRQTGFLAGAGDILNNLAIVERQVGDYPAAIAYLEEALEVYRSAGDRGGEGAVLNNIGLAYTYLGRWVEAEAYLDEALALHRDMQSRQAELETLNIRGVLAYRGGAWETAIARFEEVIAIARRVELSGSEMAAHYGLGQALLGAGRSADAAAEYEEAARMATSSGARAALADALAGLHRATGDPGAWTRALALYTDLGLSPDDRL